MKPCPVLEVVLAKNGVTVLEHPLYLPDLAPADFMLFPQLKLALEGKRFDDVQDIQQHVAAELKAISSKKKNLKEAFRDLYRRCEQCIAVYGDYFEGR